MKLLFHSAFTILLSISLFSCVQKEVSTIEKIVIDDEFINSQIADYDSIEVSKPNDRYTKTIYHLKNSTTIIILRDSLEKLKAWGKLVNNIKIDGAELYPNGQICGKLNYKNGEPDGEAKYYHSNGRISGQGIFKNGYWWGEWRKYDEDGNLIKLEFIDDDRNWTFQDVK